MNRVSLVAILACQSVAASSLAAAPRPALNKFSVATCNRILEAKGEAAKTLKAILAATNTRSCADFKLDARGRTEIASLDLKGQGLTDLAPFRLFSVQGDINLANNNLSEVGPLVNAAHGGTRRINLSHNKLTDAAFLAKNFSGALILDGNELDDPAKLAGLTYASDFSLRGNRSARGADYDAALETMYRLYALFTSTNSNNYRPQFDLEGMRAALAPKLSRYVTLKDVTVEAVFEDAQRFYKEKKDVVYRIHLDTFQVAKQGEQVTATYLVDYTWLNDDLGVPARESDSYRHLSRRKIVEAEATAAFDSTFHVVSYAEKTHAGKRLTVVKPTWGTKNVADVANYLADTEEATAEFPQVKIPKRAQLKYAFEYINSFGSKYDLDDNFCKVIFKGKTLWVMASSAPEGDEDGEVYVRGCP